MEEIIAKSKAFKAARQKQKDEDEAALEALDASFRDLVGAAASRGGVGAAAARGAAAAGGRGSALAGLLKPPGYDK
jgi:glycerate kinase